MASLGVVDLFNVKGRVAVVTGGSSGLGLMICKGLVTNGAKVYVVALPTDPITEIVDALNELGKGSGGHAEGFSCDVSSKEFIFEFARAITMKEKTIDMLISNAGIRRDPPTACNVLTAPLTELQASMWSMDESAWVNTFKVNTTSHYYLSIAFLPLLAAAADQEMSNGIKGRDEGRGVIVVTSSCASMHNVTNVDLTSYATSKAATDHLVKLLAAKYNRFYVRVIGINPGCFQVVPSNMNPVGAEGNIFSSLFDKVPAKRAGRSEDIAGTILYLVSKAGFSAPLRSAALSARKNPTCKQNFFSQQTGPLSFIALYSHLLDQFEYIAFGTPCIFTMSTPEVEHVRGVWARTKNDSAIYRLLLSDVEIVSATCGQMQARLNLTPDHVNSRGTIHGAVSASIMDWAGGMAIATHGFEKTGASVDIHVSYLSTAHAGDVLNIHAVADRVGKSMAFTTIKISRVVDGELGPLVATGSHTKFLPVSKENRQPPS
ncbi:uncharacterized protein N7511_000042 [Penicillium nucicola]|uniref:uncharacterized protein n=1 Tax=Penicillium nucicola TaxID=1850975 RepID=UPI0025454DC3|nr:uncharacterized protein N7511_000042 [Penicillium nucicola]KAJ5775031.1 hypothetical protein N7511_000042 [Penicillium nucicola]